MEQMLSFMQTSMHDTFDVLTRRVELFHGLKPEFVATIFASGATKEVEAGATIFKKGAPGKEIFVILSGKVQISDGGRALASLNAGDLFGEMGLLSDAPRSATAKATESTTLFIINEEIFE